MPPFFACARYGRLLGLSLVGALGVQGLCLAATAPPAPPPSVMSAAEMLAERKLSDACEVVSQLGLASPDTTESERVRFHLLLAMARAGASDEAGAKRAISEALKLDRGAQMPAFASPDARRLLEEVRATLPPRERPAQALTRAADALYQGGLLLDAATLVLDLTSRAQPLSPEDQAQVTMRRGLLLMEAGEAEKAASAFAETQKLDPKAHLPGYVPPKTRKAFDDARPKPAV